jgi:hypothetical protein
MELENDAFQIIIEEESNRTQKKLLPDDLFNQTTIFDRREKELQIIDKQAINDKMEQR